MTSDENKARFRFIHEITIAEEIDGSCVSCFGGFSRFTSCVCEYATLIFSPFVSFSFIKVSSRKIKKKSRRREKKASQSRVLKYLMAFSGGDKNHGALWSRFIYFLDNKQIKKQLKPVNECELVCECWLIKYLRLQTNNRSDRAACDKSQERKISATRSWVNTAERTKIKAFLTRFCVSKYLTLMVDSNVNRIKSQCRRN